MGVLLANNAWGRTTTPISDSDTVINMSSVQASRFPGVTEGESWFYATLTDSEGNVEIVKCTSRTTGSFTVTRGADGTIARSWPAGSYFSMRWNAAVIEDIRTASNDNIETLVNSIKTVFNGIN